MLELYLPYFISVLLGASPATPSPDMAANTLTPEIAVPETAPVKESAAQTAVPDAVAAREPESQQPTGLFTTATEVKPILGMTRASWVAIQQTDGTDFVYFTNLLAWRCGMWEVRYGLNGAVPDTAFPLEPCHDETASPNAITDPIAYPIYVVAPGGSVDSIELEILFDDGTADAAVYSRQSVLMP